MNRLTYTILSCAIALTCIGTSHAAEELHPFMELGGPVDKSVVANLPAPSEAETYPEPSQAIIGSDSFTYVDTPGETHRERTLSPRAAANAKKISPLTNSDSFTQVDNMGEQNVERPFSLGFLDGLLGGGKKKEQTANTGATANTQTADTAAQASVQPIINQNSTGGLSQSDSFTTPNNPREQTREHSFSLF